MRFIGRSRKFGALRKNFGEPVHTLGKAYKPVQKFLQNSQSFRSYVTHIFMYRMY